MYNDKRSPGDDKAIRKVESADVYNMEVKDHHNYSVNGGLIIHNCDALRYGVATVIYSKRRFMQ